MVKGTRLNLILLIMFIVLGGIALLVEKPFAARSEKYFESGLLYEDLNPNDIWGLLIRRGKEEVEIRRTPAGWIIPTYYDHPANFSKIEEAVGRVMRWRNEIQIGRTKKKHEKMAVNEETGTFVSLRPQDVNGAPLAEFYVGRIGGFDPDRLAPGGKIDPDAITFYMRPFPGDDVYLINEFLLGTFSFQPENWADLRVFKFPKDSIVKVAAEGEEETVVIERKGEDWVVEGLGFPADQNLVSQAVDAFQYVQGVKVVDPAIPPEELGLDSPRASATATLKDGRELRLLIGKKKDDRSVYGKPERGRYTYEFNTSFFDRLFKKKEAFVNTTLTTFSGWSAKRIILHHEDEEVVLEKDDRQWTLTSPEGVEVDPRAVNGIVSSLGRLKHEAYVEKAGDLGKFGLDPPAFRAEVEMEEETHVILVGTQDEEGRYYVMKGQEEWIVLLSEETVASFRKRAEDLRQRTPEELAEEEAKRKAEAERAAALKEVVAPQETPAPDDPKPEDPPPEETEEETPRPDDESRQEKETPPPPRTP